MAKKVNKQTDVINPNGLNDSEMGLTEVPANIPSNDVFTSYIFSSSNRSLSKYGERLLMEVISVAQEYTIDAALGINKLNFDEKYSEKFAIVDIPVKNLLNADDNTNYTKAKAAAVELMKIYHTVEAPVLDENGVQKTYKDGTPQYQFASYHLLDQVTINQKPGIVSVKLGAETWSQILDMGKGYTRYNLLTAKNLDDVVAIRLFQLMSNTSVPLNFSLDRIKGILGLQNKYVNNPTGFIRRVIVPAEDEIREKCPFEVVHDLVYEKTSTKGRPTIVGITLSKVVKPTIIKDASTVLNAQTLRILFNEFKFDDKGVRSNLKLFDEVQKAGHDLIAFLEKIGPKAKIANSPQAYVIKSLQNLLEGEKSVAVKPAKIIISKPAELAEPVRETPRKTRTASKTGGKQRLSVKKAEDFDDSGLEEL